MQAFTEHTGTVATLDRSNVDTDQIIPKQFLKSIQRTGFGKNLFYDWRYLPDGSPDPDFELNRSEFKGATILLTRNNFGCGSSREHAVWAVMQYGFRVVIAPWEMRGDTRVPGFADIFRNNSAKNGLLTIEFASDRIDRLFRLIERHPGIEASVSLEEQTVRFHTADGEDPVLGFDIDAGVKNRLLHGLDDISLSLQYEDRIAAFEREHDPQLYRR